MHWESLVNIWRRITSRTMGRPYSVVRDITYMTVSVAPPNPPRPITGARQGASGPIQAFTRRGNPSRNLKVCCQYLKFNTKLFGIGIGRVSATELTDELAMHCCDWADENSVQCLYYLCSASDSTSIQIADRYGFPISRCALRLHIYGWDTHESAPSRLALWTSKYAII